MLWSHFCLVLDFMPIYNFLWVNPHGVSLGIGKSQKVKLKCQRIKTMLTCPTHLDFIISAWHIHHGEKAGLKHLTMFGQRVKAMLMCLTHPNFIISSWHIHYGEKAGLKHLAMLGFSRPVALKFKSTDITFDRELEIQT